MYCQAFILCWSSSHLFLASKKFVELQLHIYLLPHFQENSLRNSWGHIHKTHVSIYLSKFLRINLVNC